MNDPREIIARAMGDLFGSDDVFDDGIVADTILRALSEAGMVVAPKIPHPHMLWAFQKDVQMMTNVRLSETVLRAAYAAMLSATEKTNEG